MIDALQARVRGLDPAGPHIRRIEVGGQAFWVKRAERPTLRMRVQKGSPARAFAAERQALRELNAAGAPVPPLCLEGADFVVVPDCGVVVATVLRSDPDPLVRAAALFEAGRALGRLHGLGFSHGRPSPKDMCLMDGTVTLIDFERYRTRLNRPRGHARDLVVFAFNVLVNALDDGPEVADALAGYRETAPDTIWPLAQAMARRMAWADWLTRPVQRLEGRAREFKAIPRTRALFLDG
jgi:tRNA A-37 threonylcarbamoyl transferase component Bud32